MRGWMMIAVLLAGLTVVPDDASAQRWRRGRYYARPSVRAYVGPRYYARPYYYNRYRPYYYRNYYRGYYGWPRSYYYAPGYYYAPLYRSGIHWYW